MGVIMNVDQPAHRGRNHTGAWRGNVKVMVSSRSKELAEERKVITEVIEDLGCDPLVFERLPATGRDTEEESLRMATNCNIYVLLIAESYADIVVKEYQKAREHLREEILVFIKQVPHDERVAEFIRDLDKVHTRNTFNGLEDLPEKVRAALLRVFEDAVVDRQSQPREEAYGVIWKGAFYLNGGHANYTRFMALKGDQTTGLVEANDNFDVYLVDEPNYANMKSRKRFEYVFRWKERRAVDLTAVIPHDGFYYLWIETGSIGKTAFAVELRRHKKMPRTKK